MGTILKGAAIGAAIAAGAVIIMTGAIILWLVSPRLLISTFGISNDVADLIRFMVTLVAGGSAAGALVGFQIWAKQ